MTRLLVVCCFSLLLAGVFGADVTAIKGNSVTLLINSEEIKEADDLLWMFEQNNIATIDLEGENSIAEYPDKRFSGRLNLDRNTGSLTISNIRTEDKGVYKLEIMSSEKSKYKTFSVTVNDETSTVSVTKGYAVTLPTGVKIRPDDAQWKFNGNIIANLTGSTSTNIKVNNETGELKITNFEQSGEYEVEINAGDFILRNRLRVIFSETEPLSGKVGKSITLNIDNETQAEDVIEVKFENTLIAKVEKNKFLYTNDGNRFSGRLKLNDEPRSLLITHITAEDSGLYDVNINNIKHIIHRRYSVTVTDSSSSSHQEKTGPGIFVIVIMLVIALI